jgi:hypothetical protein
MKLLLSLAHYHITYLIIKFIRIDRMFLRLEDCSIFIGPFTDPLSHFMNPYHPCYSLNIRKRPMFVAHHEFWCLSLPLTL